MGQESRIYEALIILDMIISYYKWAPGMPGPLLLDAELEGPLQEGLLTRLDDLPDHLPCCLPVELDMTVGASDLVVHDLSSHSGLIAMYA